MPESPADYAALLRGVRDTENLRLELHKVNNDLKSAQTKVMSLEQQTAAMTQLVREKDKLLAEMKEDIERIRAESSKALHEKDENIRRLQDALKSKHLELEDLKEAKGGIFKRKS